MIEQLVGSQLEVIILVNGVMNNVGFTPVSWCRSKTGRFEQHAVWWFVGITRCGLHLSMVAASPLMFREEEWESFLVEVS